MYKFGECSRLRCCCVGTWLIERTWDCLLRFASKNVSRIYDVVLCSASPLLLGQVTAVSCACMYNRSLLLYLGTRYLILTRNTDIQPCVVHVSHLCCVCVCVRACVCVCVWRPPRRVTWKLCGWWTGVENTWYTNRRISLLECVAARGTFSASRKED